MSEEKQQTAAFDTQPAGLEKTLADFYSKTITVNLPEGARKWLADSAWWLTLIGGILALIGAWNYWQFAHMANQWLDLARAYGVTTQTSLGFMWYVALIVLVVEGVMSLVAVGKLKAKQKSGWNLLYYISLLSVVLGVFYLFVPGYGFGSLLGMVIGTLIGWFFLFQVRRYFVRP